MNVRVEKACGIDVHKSFLVATMLTCEGVKETKEFNTGLEDLIDLREWIIERHCQRVAVESTGIYWIPLYTCLEGKVETIVANPRFIKNIPGRFYSIQRNKRVKGSDKNTHKDDPDKDCLQKQGS